MKFFSWYFTLIEGIQGSWIKPKTRVITEKYDSEGKLIERTIVEE